MSLLSLIEDFLEKYLPIDGVPRPLDGYWPDERPVSVLIHNLHLLTKKGALPWVEHSTAREYSAIRVGSTSLAINEITGEVATELLGYPVTIYRTKGKEDKPYFLLAISYDGVVRRIAESDEHRNFQLWSIYESVSDGKPQEKKEVPYKEIDKACQRADESLQSLFLIH